MGDSLWGSHQVTVMNRNELSGELSWIESQTAGGDISSPRGLAISPNGRNVYVCSSGNNKVLIFRRDIMSGKLHSSALAPAQTFSGPVHIAASLDGNNIYVASSNAIGIFIATWTNAAGGTATGLISQVGSSIEYCGGDSSQTLSGIQTLELTNGGQTLYVGLSGGCIVPNSATRKLGNDRPALWCFRCR